MKKKVETRDRNNIMTVTGTVSSLQYIQFSLQYTQVSCRKVKIVNMDIITISLDAMDAYLDVCRLQVIK